MLLIFAMLGYAEHAAHICCIKFILSMLLIFAVLGYDEHAAHIYCVRLC